MATKNSIVQSLKQFSVASVRPEIIDPETTFIRLSTDFKYDSDKTTKDVSTLRTNIRNAIIEYNQDNLLNFTGVFRHSKLTEAINGADPSILSNITTVKLFKTITPTLNSALKYTVSFNNAFYNPHGGHNSSGGVISSIFLMTAPTNDILTIIAGNFTFKWHHRVYTSSTLSTVVHEWSSC